MLWSCSTTDVSLSCTGDSSQLTLDGMLDVAQLLAMERLRVILVHAERAKIPCLSVPKTSSKLTPRRRSFRELAVCQLHVLVGRSCGMFQASMER